MTMEGMGCKRNLHELSLLAENLVSAAAPVVLVSKSIQHRIEDTSESVEHISNLHRPGSVSLLTHPRLFLALVPVGLLDSSRSFCLTTSTSAGHTATAFMLSFRAF